jgi:hypothetical protein
MITANEFKETALRLYELCDYPAVRYCIMSKLLGETDGLSELRDKFIYSDIVNELYSTQDRFGGWGRLNSKDYSVKAKFPTSAVAINRCLYIGLKLDDREILSSAKEYLEAFLLGTSREKFSNSNERNVPWGRANVCILLEAVESNNPLCDAVYGEWLYIAERAFESGEYSYEREHAAQHEVFGTREDRLVPMQTELLLCRRENITPELEGAMLRRYGGHASVHGHFWDKSTERLPDNFVYEKTRRWFYTFNYINQFHGSALYLDGAVEWLLDSRNSEGLWDWGPQTKDPWGYFGYFSTTKNYKLNRTIDCTMEVLDFLVRYIKNNS